ncbi:hypothetical protein BIFGAL_02618 [Bifidobacterium gallicum DSM 20093 = LMG 11596]|uniref:Uncharacterized protein n=1 Tax=Bifidobacterium gallicum DSM 20093 = LMG 11596 TaxID=561180 RepID=D1NS63_9BIFI|nr:hypothetical protein BIFGAL_02618 [Bifidobacterium gallicum DSM 20093 = LMG 11596]
MNGTVSPENRGYSPVCIFNCQLQVRAKRELNDKGSAHHGDYE